MASAIAKLRPLVTRPSSQHTASLVFLHGSGDTGAGIMMWIGDLIDFSFPHVKVIFPTAPQRPYSASMGLPTNVWFDRKQISPFAGEDTESMDSMSEIIGQLIDSEEQAGISRDRIVLGDTGAGIMMWIGDLIDFSFPHVKVIFPTAPQRPYSASMGLPTNVWFDRKQISPFAGEDTESMDSMSEIIGQLIDSEEQAGISRDRIVLGGFSMGGAMSLYHGLKKGKDLAGLFALSAFLGQESTVYKHLEEHGCETAPEILQCHGCRDPLVQEKWGLDTHKRLKALGVQCSYYTYPDLSHEINEDELQKVVDFVNRKLPEL